MALGPAVVDLPELPSELQEDDLIYVIRPSLGINRDKKALGTKVIATKLDQDTTVAIDLSTYLGDLMIFANPTADITFTLSNELPKGRKLTIINKASAYNITLAGVLTDVIVPSGISEWISDGTTMLSNQSALINQIEDIARVYAHFYSS